MNHTQMEFIDINDARTDELLEYVETLVLIYTRDINDVNDEELNWETLPHSQCDNQRFCTLSNVSMDFIKRYNEKKLTHYFTYDDFFKNVEIKSLIKHFNLDQEKFWLLLLFAYDYSESLCINGINVAPSACEQIDSLIESVNLIIKDFSWEHGTILKKDAKITFSAKGEENIIIDNPTALHFIADTLTEKLSNEPIWREHFIMNYHKPLEDSKSMSDSPYIYYFAKMFLNFFNVEQTVKSKRKKGASHAIKELELVSHLIYFTKLSTNKTWIDIEKRTLKSYLKQYKNLDLALRRSNTYTNFHI